MCSIDTNNADAETFAEFVFSFQTTCSEYSAHCASKGLFERKDLPQSPSTSFGRVEVHSQAVMPGVPPTHACPQVVCRQRIRRLFMYHSSICPSTSTSPTRSTYINQPNSIEGDCIIYTIDSYFLCMRNLTDEQTSNSRFREFFRANSNF